MGADASAAAATDAGGGWRRRRWRRVHSRGRRPGGHGRSLPMTPPSAQISLPPLACRPLSRSARERPSRAITLFGAVPRSAALSIHLCGGRAAAASERKPAESARHRRAPPGAARRGQLSPPGPTAATRATGAAWAARSRSGGAGRGPCAPPWRGAAAGARTARGAPTPASRRRRGSRSAQRRSPMFGAVLALTISLPKVTKSIFGILEPDSKKFEMYLT